MREALTWFLLKNEFPWSGPNNKKQLAVVALPLNVRRCFFNGELPRK
jgi:hypothetical protein